MATGITPRRPQTPSQAGDYSWTASYTGDPNNNAVSETSCTDANEQVMISRRPNVEHERVGGRPGRNLDH